MNENQQRLMRREAEKRLRDAEVLQRSLDLSESSDSPYILRLLGLELLMKLACAQHHRSPGEIRNASHKYDQLFAFLPETARLELVQRARERVGQSALENAVKVLEVWTKNFVRLRYPYESYPGLTQEQYERLGEEWFEAGAPLENATFVYYPEELFGFTHALLEMTADASGQSGPA